MHWPLPGVGDFVETWKAMEKMYDGGRVRAIGVSNFQPTTCAGIHGETNVTPAVNQIEMHPYLAKDEVRAFDAEHGIATEAWSPIAQGKVLDDPTIVRIAETLGKTPAQVTLRWHLQRGDIVFPKSVTRSRVEENFDLFDFELSGTDMADITALDRGERPVPTRTRSTTSRSPTDVAFRVSAARRPSCPAVAKSQILCDIARLTRTQPCDCREVGAEQEVRVDLRTGRAVLRDLVEADPAGREPGEAVQPQASAGVGVVADPGGPTALRAGGVGPGPQVARVVHDAALGQDPAVGPDQPHPVLGLADHDPPGPCAVARHRSGGAAHRRRAVQPGPGGRGQRAALRQPVGGLEADHPGAGPRAGAAVDRTGVAAERVQPALRLRGAVGGQAGGGDQHGGQDREDDDGRPPECAHGRSMAPAQ